MATTAKTVKESLETIIKAAIPDIDAALRFRLVSDDAGDLDEQAAPASLERAFEVWHGGGVEPASRGDGEYHDGTSYQVFEEFEILVSYPRTDDARALDSRIRSDVRVIKAAVDAQTNWATDVLHQWVSAWARPRRPDPRRGVDVWIQTLVVTVQFLESTT